MIYSIKFTGEGYIAKKGSKYVLRKGKTEEAYKKELEKLKDKSFRHLISRVDERRIYDKFYKTVSTGYINKNLFNNLNNRTIEFSLDKINVIFGPNASGKTTILRAIAANALCGTDGQLDGYTNPNFYKGISGIQPSIFGADDPGYIKDANNEYVLNCENTIKLMKKNLEKSIDEYAGNKVDLHWNGDPVYYENFANRRNTGNTIQDLSGSLIADSESTAGSIISYFMDKNKASMGQHAMYLLYRLWEIADNAPSLQDMIKKGLEVGRQQINRHGYTEAKIQTDYLKKMSEKYKGYEHKTTFLFDEIDKNMDILNVAGLYKEFLPKFAREKNVQVITISHNPIVLSSLLSPDEYNIISLDEEYTKNIRQILNKISFD